jgi:internalin A
MQDEQDRIDPKDMTPEQAYAEALRRIEAAVESGQDWLDLGDLPLAAIPQEIARLASQLKQLGLGIAAYDARGGAWEYNLIRFKTSYGINDLRPITGLGALQVLDLSGCDQITSLDPIASLNALQSLRLYGCFQITSLDPIAGLSALLDLDLTSCDQITSFDPITELKALRSLDVTDCEQIMSLDPIAGLIGLQSLHMFGCEQIISLDPIAGLIDLQSLNVSGCKQITSLDAIAGLNELHSLDVSDCKQITSLDPIAGLTNLQSLNLGNCDQIASLDPIAGLTSFVRLELYDVPSAQTLRIETLLQQWPALSVLFIDRLHAISPEILSSDIDDNCLPRLRNWWHDLQQGEADTHELKLFILGNGRVGKSELFRRLRGDALHGDLPSTHGIQLGRFELCRHHDDRPIFLNAWDFGGQDVYLGTHALFLKSRAIFVLAWHPEMETDAPYTEAESGLEMRHRPLQYWLDYIHSLAGDEARVIVVQTQCARESDEAAPPLRDTGRVAWYRPTISCAHQDDGVDSLRDLLKRAARHRLETPAPPRMPASWLAVRDRLVALRETYRTIDRARFDAICADTHHGASSEALLHYLHQAGDLFHQPGLFGDAIVLDQQWALDGIYTLFDRGRVLPLLRGHNGVFAPEMLDALAWNGRYSKKEQALLLSMMESCDLIFPAHQWGETRYYAMIDALPDAAASANRIAMVWPADAQAVEAVAEYAFLHDGVLRALLARIGRLAGRDAVYWRHGVCLYDAGTASRARIDTEQHADGTGHVRMRATGPEADALCAKLIALLEEIRIGAAPQITRDDASGRAALPRPSSEKDHDIQPAPIPPLPGQKPVVYISYAWGTQDNDGRRPLQEFAVSLQRSLETEFDVRRDQEAMLPGDSLEAFMREIGRGARVLVLLSDAYVYSRNCMKELENLNARNQSDPDQLRRCALPLIVDTSFSLGDDKRINYVDYWVAEAERLRQSLGDRNPTRHLSVWKTIKTVEKIADIADEMLAFMNVVLMPRGMQCLSEDDFATVKAALHRLPAA